MLALCASSPVRYHGGMQIDLGSLRKALSALERGIDRAEVAPLDEELWDAVIQRFEFTYELAWKSLRRVLADKAAEVYRAALDFVGSASDLLGRLEARA